MILIPHNTKRIYNGYNKFNVPGNCKKTSQNRILNFQTLIAVQVTSKWYREWSKIGRCNYTWPISWLPANKSERFTHAQSFLPYTPGGERGIFTSNANFQGHYSRSWSRSSQEPSEKENKKIKMKKKDRSSRITRAILCGSRSSALRNDEVWRVYTG